VEFLYNFWILEEFLGFFDVVGKVVEFSTRAAHFGIIENVNGIYRNYSIFSEY
jgi:hypothetical protein